MRILKLATLTASAAAVAAVAYKLLADRSPRVRRMAWMLTGHGAAKAPADHEAPKPVAGKPKRRAAGAAAKGGAAAKRPRSSARAAGRTPKPTE